MFELSVFLREMPIAANGKLLLDSGSYLIGLDHVGIKISKREHEVLFLYLRRKRAKLIANLLDITPRTIYKHMDSLRQKFDAHTSPKLRDFDCHADG